MENIQKNIPEVFNKQNFNMPYTGNYLHSADIVPFKNINDKLW